MATHGICVICPHKHTGTRTCCHSYRPWTLLYSSKVKAYRAIFFFWFLVFTRHERRACTKQRYQEKSMAIDDRRLLVYTALARRALNTFSQSGFKIYICIDVHMMSWKTLYQRKGWMVSDVPHCAIEGEARFRRDTLFTFHTNVTFLPFLSFFFFHSTPTLHTPIKGGAVKWPCDR